MPSHGFRGWYVELDSELIKLFEEKFPGHGSKVRVTANAIIAAVRNGHLDVELTDTLVLKPQEGSHVSGKGRRT